MPPSPPKGGAGLLDALGSASAEPGASGTPAPKQDGGLEDTPLRTTARAMLEAIDARDVAQLAQELENAMRIMRASAARE